MKFRILFAAAFAAAAWMGTALAASSPEAVIITEGDITDRPYRIIGDVSLTVKKVGIFDRPPIDEKVDIALREKAVAMGADAIILVHYDRRGFNGLSMGRIDATGRAVVFGSGTAGNTAPNTAIGTAPATAPSTAPSSSPSSSPSPTPSSATSLADAYGTGKVRAYIEALNGGDVSAVLAMLDDNVTVEDPVGTPQQGKAAAEAYVKGLVARGTKVELVLPVRGGGKDAAAAVRLRSSAGIHSAVLVFTLSPNGSIVTMKVYGGAE